MCKKDENTKIIKVPAAKRSIFLTLMGIPMMYVATLGKENIVCLIISVIYVILLFLNGIISLPIIVKEMIRKNKAE